MLQPGTYQINVSGLVYTANNPNGAPPDIIGLVNNAEQFDLPSGQTSGVGLIRVSQTNMILQFLPILHDPAGGTVNQCQLTIVQTQ
jgi:hypothetical protein